MTCEGCGAPAPKCEGEGLDQWCLGEVILCPDCLDETRFELTGLGWDEVDQ